MKEFLEIIDSLIPVISALGGAVVGGYFTRKNQKELYNRQIYLESEKEKRELLNETLSVYNKILKVDGEEILISHIGGSQYEFEIEIYNDRVRPILYEKYHILHSDVAKLIRTIDDVIQKCVHNEEVEDMDNAILMRDYSKIISNVLHYIYESRNDK